MKIKRRYLKILRFLLLLFLLIIINLGVYWVMQQGVKPNIKINKIEINKPAIGSALYKNKLADWVGAWRKAIPDFDINSLVQVKEEAFKPYQVAAYQSNPEREKLRQQLQLFSPDRTKYLDIYGGMELSEENGVIQAILDADTGVTLVDLKSKKSYGLLFSGPSGGGFHAAFWIDDSSFVVAGSEVRQEKDAYAYYPILYMFNLTDKKMSIYSDSSEVSEDNYYNDVRKTIWDNFSRKHPNIKIQ